MTIKSKAFKFLLGIAVVIGVAVAASFASAADFGTATLRVGSRGAAVMEVQKLVGVTADGAYGPMTEAAVKAWQANVGLYADGIFGPASMAKAYELAGSTGAVASGDLCPNGMTLASNCTVAPGTTTPVTLCPNGMTLASNCTVSPTGATVPVMSGDEEADLSWDVIEENDLIEDTNNQHAFTIEIEADKDGGDAKIERLDLQLLAKKTSSPVNSYRAITKVALKVDGDVIAKADTDSRSDWRGSNDTVRFSNLDLIVKSGKVVEVEVYLDVTDKADEITLGDLSWRFTDATGYVETSSQNMSAEVGFTTADALTLRVTENTKNNPDDTMLDVSSSRSNETLLVSSVEVRKGEGVIEDVDVKITFTGDDVNLAEVKDLISSLALKIDGKQVDSIRSSSFPALTGTSGDDTLTVTFDADEFEVEEGDKFDVEVLATFRAYDDGIIRDLQVSSIVFSIFDEINDDADTSTKGTTSFAPEFTLTEGDIIVYISEVVESYSADRAGTVTFEVEVENETGADLGTTGADLLTADQWDIEIKKYGLEGTITVSGGDDVLIDGGISTYKISYPFDSVSTADFAIKIISIDGKNVGFTWTK